MDWRPISIATLKSLVTIRRPYPAAGGMQPQFPITALNRSTLAVLLYLMKNLQVSVSSSIRRSLICHQCYIGSFSAGTTQLGRLTENVLWKRRGADSSHRAANAL